MRNFLGLALWFGFGCLLTVLTANSLQGMKTRPATALDPFPQTSSALFHTGPARPRSGGLQ